jgi:hypothetical protein
MWGKYHISPTMLSLNFQKIIPLDIYQTTIFNIIIVGYVKLVPWLG